MAAEDAAPLLGSSDFYPSSEHPVGWRGDGSGRFPGATPPRSWGRQLDAVSSSIIVQAEKPTGKPAGDKGALAYFTVKDWLIAGPFPVNDPEKDIDHDFIGAEADVKPDAGDKAGDKVWQVHRANEAAQSYRNHNEQTNAHLYVDFLYAYGILNQPTGKAKFATYENADKQAAYAHTWLYAPQEADVSLRIIHAMPAVKMWLNGQPQRVESSGRKALFINIHLKAGWNRLLVKVICNEAQKPWRNKYVDPRNVLGKSLWRFAAYIRPASDGPFTYKTKNISWILKLTGRNASQPITVGDKLYVGSGDTDLFCLDKNSGKIQWLHTVTYRDAMSETERAALTAEATAMLEQLETANTELVTLLNGRISPQGLSTDQMDAIDKTIEARNDLARDLHRALATGKKGKLYDNEVSAGNATPCSDGKLVYWVVQGNGGYLTSAFDLDGNKIWSSYEYQKSAGEHGSHRSPLLCDGRLLVSTNQELIAYDAANGKELWRTPGYPSGHGTTGAPVIAELNGKRVLWTQKNIVSLDGEMLSKREFPTWGTYLPVVEDGFLYNPCTRRHSYEFQAIAIQKEKGSGWKLDKKTLYGPLNDSTAFFYVASPLYVDGLVYQVECKGILLAVDTRKRALAYRRFLDGYNFNHRFLYGYCASPCLAGEHIYLLDGVGYATILKHGSDGTLIGNNSLQNISNIPKSAPGGQEAFYGGMYFEGKRMFVHSDNYLYCIEENDKGWTTAQMSVQARETGKEENSKTVKEKIITAQLPDDSGQLVHARMFRGSHYGNYPTSKIPLTWSAETKPLWKVEIGTGYGSPVISGDRVFMTTEPNKLHCLDLKSGNILWSREHGFDQLSPKDLAKAEEQSTVCGYASPTPCTDGKHVWVNYGTGVVAAYDMQGKRQWITYLDQEQKNEYGRSASPVLADGKLILTITHLMAMDPKTGHVLWEQKEVEEVYGTPAVTQIGDRDVLVTPNGYIIAADDGSILFSDMGTTANASPVIHDGVVYFCDAETTAWKLPKTLQDKPEELWLKELPGEFFGSPVLHQGILYCMANEGNLFAVNAADGTLIYEECLVDGEMAMEFGEVYPSLVLAHNMLLVTNNPGHTAIIQPGPECKRIRVNKLEPGSGSTPAVNGNQIFIHTGSDLINFGATDE